jgi:hypothetical protein
VLLMLSVSVAICKCARYITLSCADVRRARGEQCVSVQKVLGRMVPRAPPDVKSMVRVPGNTEETAMARRRPCALGSEVCPACWAGRRFCSWPIIARRLTPAFCRLAADGDEWLVQKAR